MQKQLITIVVSLMLVGCVANRTYLLQPELKSSIKEIHNVGVVVPHATVKILGASNLIGNVNSNESSLNNPFQAVA